MKKSQKLLNLIAEIQGTTGIGGEIKHTHGYGIDDALNLFKKGSFDLIISRAVLEHIYYIEKAFNVMDVLLKSGGIMIHKIDFRDHGMFSENGFHPRKQPYGRY